MEYRSGVWEEMIPGILSAIHGNRKIIPDLWVLRHRIQGGAHGIDRICHSSARDTFFYGITEQTINKETLKPVCTYLSNIVNIDENESFETIKSVLKEKDENVVQERKKSVIQNTELSGLVSLMDSTANFYQ